MHIDCIHGLAKEYLVVFFFFLHLFTDSRQIEGFSLLQGIFKIQCC